MRTRRLLLLALATVLFVTCRAHGQSPDADLTAVDLRCEHLENPLGIGEVAPRLSWGLRSAERGATQSAYRVMVGSTEESLLRGQPDLWDTGRVESAETQSVVYGGAALGPDAKCFWRVRAWDGQGRAGPWSETGHWELGLLTRADWYGEWMNAGPNRVGVTIRRAEYAATNGAARADVTEIVRGLTARGAAIVASNDAMGGDPAPGVKKRLVIEYEVGGVEMRAEAAEGGAAVLNNTKLPYLRRAFRVEKPVRSARLRASALGLYEPWLNGERVGDAWLAPGWTDYRVRVHAQTIDVTDGLRRGENVVGFMVGPGWYAGRAGLFHARGFYGGVPGVMVQLDITYEDGTTTRVVGDASWERHDGPIIVSDIMDGEVYDARAEVPGWCAPGAGPDKGGGWMAVTTRAETVAIEPPPDLPVRVLERLPARSVRMASPGRWVFDLGQNMVGVAQIRVKGEAGRVVTLRHAEMLNPDGTLYVENLRGAAATDSYVCRGNGEETWSPRFTFHGFRYVEVSGLESAPEVGAVEGLVLGSDLPPTGEFECSDSRLNRLYSNIVWGLRGNYVSIPTDCPQRDERMGWMGDAQAFIPTASRLANVAPFMSKWMVDVRDAQRADGAHADVAPVMKGLSYGTPAWADAGVIVPWTIYEVYGDRRVLERNIDSMRAWVEWCRVHSTGLIRDKDRGNDYGDWLSIEADTPKDLIGTAYFARSADLLARSYNALGRAEDAAMYRGLFEEVRRAFASRFITAGGTVANGTQTSYLLALAFDLVPPERREDAMGHLLRDLEARGWRLSTGFIGVGLLLPTLDDAGHPDAAYRLLVQDEFPSWLFSVKHGATTIWERWNGWTPDKGMNDPGMNSFNHYALGSCGEWLFTGVGGIRADEPGFGRCTIRPRIGGGLTWARASVHTVRGKIGTAWRLQDGRVTLQVSIPANLTATVHVPTADPSSVREGGTPIDRVTGVRVERREEGALVLQVGSGEWTIAAEAPRDAAR